MKHIKFSYKIMIMPLLAILVLCVFLFVTRFFNQRNTELLTHIETGFVPALEWAYALEGKLTAIQRNLQDAVALADEEELVAGDALADEFRALLQEGRRFPGSVTKDMDRWEAAFHDYYTQAREVSLYLIEGASLSEGVVEQL